MEDKQNRYLSSIDRFLVKISKNIEEENPPYVVFGIFGIITYPLYHLIWLYATSQSYENLTLRLIATILCIPLAFKKFLPKNLNRCLPIYWNIVILYCLPFLFTFMLLKNNFSYIWAMNGMTALVLCILLLNVLQLLILLPVGIFIGVLTYLLAGNPAISFPSNYLVIIITYSSVIIFGALFAHRKERIQKEKLNAMATVGASIAHELRTPFSSISIGIGNLKETVPDLIQAYQLAEKAKLSVSKISPNYLKTLNAVLNSIESETKAAHAFTEMLLMNVNPSWGENKKETFSMAGCINNALSRYPFKRGQQEFIVWDDKKQDFSIYGDHLLVIHILFNLIKNSLYYIAASGKSRTETKIEIWLESGHTNNKLYFRDTGAGISPDILPHIFDRFFSKTHRGAGIGLTYCKMVMESLGGSILCESTIGDYTQFILVFPSTMSNNLTTSWSKRKICYDRN